MKWITNITINNFRAFKGPYTPITIPSNHHVLIYGENGSGKTSLFHALNDFFQSSADSKKPFDTNYFETLAGNSTGSIELLITDIDANGVITTLPPSIFGNPDTLSNHRTLDFQLANKVKGFLDYRKVLHTHFEIDKTPDGRPNLFDLLIEQLLADHLIGRAGGGVATYPLGEEWKRICDPIYTLDRRYADHNDAINELPVFGSLYQQLLLGIFTEFRRLISSYFDPKLDIGVALSQLEMDYEKWDIKRELFLDIKYAGQPIPSYDTFLNEARLSAIGISLYLAALKTYPKVSDLRVLYLDDVFIGLDTNNRIPLLKILKNEFIDDGFQLFLSTYDRQWYETARAWLDAEKVKTHCIELYANDDDANPLTPDVPIVVSPGGTYFDKAKQHFDAKDYPAAANYLRKACEFELKRILPTHQTVRVKHETDEIVRIDKLETLIDNFNVFMAKNHLSGVPFVHFKTYRKIVFNPLSHDDLETPHYKQEILDGFRIVTELQKIRVKNIASASDSTLRPMKLGVKDIPTLTMIHYEIVVLENLQIIQQGSGAIQLTVVDCQMSTNGDKKEFPSLNSALDQLWKDRGYSGVADYQLFYSNISVTGRKKLTDLMSF